jgi:hypothetical protein
METYTIPGTDTKVMFKSSDDAFDFAIDCGRLTINKTDTNYAGNYMYMGTYAGKDQFKHIKTGKYLS